MSVDLIPIGTILAILTSQVIKTANAANEVVFEKESFKVLAKHLFEIEPVLKELQRRNLDDSRAALTALKSLESDVKRANAFVEKYRERSRFYLLLKCRVIADEVQSVTRDIGRSLAALHLAGNEVLSGISDQVNRLQSEMQRSTFEASDSHARIVDLLDQGQRAHKQDQSFANEMLLEIAKAVGVPIDPLEISRELADFRRDKEEFAAKKKLAEEFFLTQVIELLSRADAARDYEEVKRQYKIRVQTMERSNWREEYVRPLRSFHCCVTSQVMEDPVSLCTGTTCERSAIVARFEAGDRTDPISGEVLEDLTLRSNVPLRQSIAEWRELKYCLEIRGVMAKLTSGVDELIGEALSLVQELVKESFVNKDWISIEGFVEIVVPILLGDGVNRDLEREILITLKVFVEGNTRNKEEVIESRVWDHVIRCLDHDSDISSTAIKLLHELLQGRTGWNVSACQKLSQQPNSIVFLVKLLDGSERELAEKILMKLLEVDEDNYSCAAKAGWFEPLIDCLIEGPEKRRETMVRAIVKLELNDPSLKLLGERGVIPILIQMANGNTESKEQSLSALSKLSTHEANRHLIAESGGVCLITDLMFSPNTRSIIAVKCCEILEKISSGQNATRLFMDGNRERLDLNTIVTNLLLLLQRPNSGQYLRKPALKTLLGIFNSEPFLVDLVVITAKDVSLVLNLLDDYDSEIREVSIRLLFLFSKQEQEGIVEHFLRPRRAEALVGFLESEGNSEVRLAAAGLLVNIPSSPAQLTETLRACGGHTALVKMLTSGTMEVKENALGALFRFADPESLELQRSLVEAGIYPLLVDILTAGSVTAKARAASLIGCLSSSSQKLTDLSNSSLFCCLKPKGVSLCPAHGGVCGAASSFCILEAKALPELVKLLLERVNETSLEAIRALSTLVNEKTPSRGASVLHLAGAIKLVLEVLSWGKDLAKEEALGLLEKVFMSREMVQNYATSARPLLADDGRLTGKSAKVLAVLERNSKSSMSFLRGSSGGN